MTLRAFLALIVVGGGVAGGTAAEVLDPAVLKRVKDATVFLRVTPLTVPAQGSGFYIAKSVIVTNAHVLGIITGDPDFPSPPPTSITVVVNSGVPGKEATCPGKLLGFDARCDLAYVRVDTPCANPLVLAEGKAVTVTTPVYLFGYPPRDLFLRPLPPNPSLASGSGTVSGLRAEDNDQAAAIQIDGEVTAGSNGGPVVLKTGEVAGVAAAGPAAPRLGFAIPGDYVRSHLTGRVHAIHFENQVHAADGTYGLDVTVTALDPLERIKGVTLEYWAGKRFVPRAVDPKTHLLTHGAPDDGLLQRVVLKKDAAPGTWKGSITRFALPPARDMFCRTTWANAEGAQAANAASYSHLRGAAVEKGADPPAATGGGGASVADTGPVPVPVAPTGVAPLTALEERDDKGRSRLHATTREERITLDKGLLQLTTTPTGKEVFAIFKDRAAVAVLDPEGLKPLDEIPTPENPVMMWSDDTRIVVACSESKVVSIIDAVKRKPLRSVRLKDNPELVPVGVIGRAPDGTYMTTWSKPDAPFWDISLYQISDAGQARFITTGAIDWCTYALDGTMVLGQSNFHTTPCGKPELLYPGSGYSNVSMIMDYHLFGEGLGFNRDFTHCFLTFDRTRIVMPTQNPEAGGMAWTWLPTTDLKHFVVNFPGAALAEVPHDHALVSWARVAGDATMKKLQVFYADSADGHVTRIVDIADADPVYSVTRCPVIPSAIYVPGHELLLRQMDADLHNGVVLCYRCGPVVRSAPVPADH